MMKEDDDTTDIYKDPTWLLLKQVCINPCGGLIFILTAANNSWQSTAIVFYRCGQKLQMVYTWKNELQTGSDLGQVCYGIKNK